ncbi:oxidation resistance protein 1 isoform X1 [Corythoichthys intestinalis]|uniref:oxidation resistance protein 1 isoform X1 n=1 Tax=Corythoichthys intestinalis TaxID=161448 RepID=UPI0025A55B48|nr:oxidation resistance protein 1 isoform X1 [Corythoichthys intestinalis]
MAQSVRRMDISIEHKPQRDKTRTSYFGNVKSRLGSKLPSGVSQPPTFAKPPWDIQPVVQGLNEPSVSNLYHHQYRTTPVQPLDHIPHIRNPILRQYYLQGTSWDTNTAVKQELKGKLSNAGKSSSTDESVFSISSRFGGSDTAPCSHSRSQSSPLCSALFRMEQQQAEEGKSTVEASLVASKKRMMLEMDSDISDRHAAPAQSPLPEAEYDKLLDVEAVPMPDGQLCLLALPPECCPGEGPDATPYLKLFCRHITDRKGIVSGILLVTTNKLFFDPCKTHPLVKEHGCEEYLLSCSVDKLVSVSFFSDISHVRFHSSQQRRKGKKLFHRIKTAKSQEQKGESLSLLEPGALSNLSLNEETAAGIEQTDSENASEKKQLDKSPSEVLSEASGGALGVAATFCCGAPELPGQGRTDELPSSSVSSPTPVSERSPAGSPRCVMFVRLRVQSSAGQKRRVGGFQFGVTEPTAAVREAWIALSQESSDELHAFLEHRRPDLRLHTGEEDGEADYNEEEFVLVEDKDEKELEDMLQKQQSSGDDWEMVLMEDNREKQGLLTERDPEGINAIVEKSHILEASHVRELYKEMPPKTVGYTWQLAYSTSCHGSSLKSLYRKVSQADSPNLLVIKDTLDEVFGAFLSHPLRLSEAFYGTGETFLFMLHPRFKCFRWTGENSFFIKGDLDSFAIGGGSGHFGLWVDENLYLGRSSPCYTFNNCCLSETDDFRIMELEVWTFC